MRRRLARLLPVIGLIIFLVVASTVASAAFTSNVETAYEGGEESQNQAIEVTYTISPDGDTINDLTIDFDSTASAFIQSNSFSITVTPGGADANVESRPGDTFYIDELESNEEITFVFEVYPKTIKQEQLDVVTVRTEYVQNGQELSNSETAAANLSASPWFSLQEAEGTIAEREDRIETLENRVDRLSLLGQVTDAMLWVGVLVGLVGVGFGVYNARKGSGDVADLREEHADKIENLARRMDKKLDQDAAKELAEEIRDEGGPGGEGPGGPW